MSAPSSQVLIFVVHDQAILILNCIINLQEVTYSFRLFLENPFHPELNPNPFLPKMNGPTPFKNEETSYDEITN